MAPNQFLIPIDFSENSITALKFAIGLTKGLNSSLLLLHVTAVNDLSERFRDNLGPEHQLQLWEGYAKSHGCMATSLHITADSVSKTILNTASETGASMIIMGTKGATNQLHKLIGTNASHVLTNTPCPVLVIPRNMPYMQLSKVVIAVDPATENEHTMTWVTDFVCKPKTRFVLWTAASKQDETEVKEYHKRLTQIIHKQAPICNIESFILPDHEALPKLEHWLKDLDADLLVVTTHHRNLFEKLFDPGITKKMVFRTEIPILAIPQVKQPLYFFM